MSREITFAIVFSVLLGHDIVGNTLVILVILKYRAMKTPMNYLLLTLAVADIMVGIFFAPTFLFAEHLFAHPSGTVGDVLCKVLTGRNVGWVASLVAAFVLVSVAVERFYAVVHPTSIRHKITKRKLKRIVPACWILATVHTIPSFVRKSYDADLQVCRGLYPHYWKIAYFMLWLISAGIVPVGLMMLLYSRVIRSLWLQNNDSGTTRFAVINSRKRITKTSITVSIIYAACVFPTHVLDVVFIFYPDIISDDDLYLKITYCFLVFNSTINPFIYAFQWKNFQRYLKRLLGCSRQIHSQETPL